jgi:hypothetical protein
MSRSSSSITSAVSPLIVPTFCAPLKHISLTQIRYGALRSETVACVAQVPFGDMCISTATNRCGIEVREALKNVT